MATSLPTCTVCSSHASLVCSICKSSPYCKLACQKKEKKLHDVFCRPYTNFRTTNERPPSRQTVDPITMASIEYFRYIIALLLPEQGPLKFVWVFSSREHNGFLSYERANVTKYFLGDTQHIYTTASSPSSHIVEVLHRKNSLVDGSKVNTCLRDIQKGQRDIGKHEWRGPIMVMGISNTQLHGGAKAYLDISLVDALIAYEHLCTHEPDASQDPINNSAQNLLNISTQSEAGIDLDKDAPSSPHLDWESFSSSPQKELVTLSLPRTQLAPSSLAHLSMSPIPYPLKQPESPPIRQSRCHKPVFTLTQGTLSHANMQMAIPPLLRPQLAFTPEQVATFPRIQSTSYQKLTAASSFAHTQQQPSYFPQLQSTSQLTQVTTQSFHPTQPPPPSFSQAQSAISPTQMALPTFHLTQPRPPPVSQPQHATRPSTHTIQGVIITCRAEQLSYHTPTYMTVFLPPTDTIISTGILSPISQHLEIPLLLEKLPIEGNMQNHANTLPRWTEDDYINAEATNSLLVGTDPDLGSQEWGNPRSHAFGSGHVGSVLVIRSDRKAITPEQVEALVLFNAVEVVPAMQELHPNYVGFGIDLLGARKDLLETLVCKVKFEEFFEVLKKDKVDNGDKIWEGLGWEKIEEARRGWAEAVSPYNV